MDYTVPNFGQYGFVEPKSGFNWQTIFWFIVIALTFGGII
jgi:hypothetical protein